MTDGWNGTGEHPLVYLREHGWTQNALARVDGSVCTVGATVNARYATVNARDAWPSKRAVVSYGRNFDHLENEAVLQVINELSPGREWPTVEDWNDDPSRTQEDVELVLGKVYGEPL